MGQNEKELLLAKLADAGKRSQKRPCFLGFLNENESAFAWDFLKRGAAAGTPMFWGGYEEAERKLLGLFPDYLEPDQNLFPLMPLTFFYRKEDALTHRDFLGALMSLGVEISFRNPAAVWCLFGQNWQIISASISEKLEMWVFGFRKGRKCLCLWDMNFRKFREWSPPSDWTVSWPYCAKPAAKRLPD